MRIERLEDLIGEFVERAHAMVWCNVATIDAQGRVQSRVLHPIWDGAVGYIGSRSASPKMRQIAAAPWVSLAYVSDIVKPVYAECRATIVTDPAERARAWDRYKQAPPPLGFDYGTLFTSADDPAFGLIRVDPWRIKVQDAPAAIRVWEGQIRQRV
jgi:hypothetical protein